jgi:hypothetical protein
MKWSPNRHPALFAWSLVLFVIVASGAIGTLALLAQSAIATDIDRLLAQVEISLDGHLLTFRGAAPDNLRVCVAPRAKEFGPTRCFTVGQVRRGEVRAR